MWLRHWGLTRDPFIPSRSPYVSLPSHDEAVARIAFAIERGERLTWLIADEGLGKSTVLQQAIAEMRNPHRRFVRVLASSHEQGFLGLVADDLGRHFGNKGRGRSVWSDISRAVTTAGLEGYQVVLVFDRCDDALNPTVVRDLTSLLDCKSPGIPQGSLMIVGRHPSGSLSDIFDSWTPAIGLERLTRTQAATYLDTKLGAAGCRETVFTPRALTRLHAYSQGVPRGIEQIATLVLMAGALQKFEVVTPDLVDRVALQRLDARNALPEPR